MTNPDQSPVALMREAAAKVAAILKKPYSRVIVPEEDGSYFGHIFEFPGCFATGATPADTFATLEDVAESWLLATLEQGQSVPEPIDIIPSTKAFRNAALPLPEPSSGEWQTLRELAKKATPGPWEVQRNHMRTDCDFVIGGHSGWEDTSQLYLDRVNRPRHIGGKSLSNGGFDPEDAAYIAACSPDVILRLIAAASPAAPDGEGKDIEAVARALVSDHVSPDSDEFTDATFEAFVADIATALRAERERSTARIAGLEGALEAYNSAAVIDILMDGPRLQGFTQSALRRAWPIGRAALASGSRT